MQSLKKTIKKMNTMAILAIVLIVALLVTFSVFLIRNIRLAEKSGIFKQHKTAYELLMDHKKFNQTSVADVEYIDTWMTFQYINFVFNIKESYLKDILKIEDPRYPNMPLGWYIKSKNLDKVKFIENLKKIVREYISLHPVK